MLLVPSFGSFFVYTTFKLNQEEISKTICVQRKMIFNSCNGRCELQKSLKKYSDNEKRMQDNLKEKAEVIYIQHVCSNHIVLNQTFAFVIYNYRIDYLLLLHSLRKAILPHTERPK